MTIPPKPPPVNHLGYTIPEMRKRDKLAETAMKEIMRRSVFRGNNISNDEIADESYSLAESMIDRRKITK